MASSHSTVVGRDFLLLICDRLSIHLQQNTTFKKNFIMFNRKKLP